MADLVVDARPRFEKYTATAGQTAFNIPFEYDAASHVKVLHIAAVDGAETVYSTSSGPLAVAPQAGESGTATLPVACAAGDSVIVYGETSNERAVNFASKVAPGSINIDNNRLIMLRQEDRRDIDHALRLRLGQAPLPKITRDKFVGGSPYLDVDGKWQTLPSTSVATVAAAINAVNAVAEKVDDGTLDDFVDKQVGAENTLAQLQARTPAAGEIQFLKGRDAVGDVAPTLYVFDETPQAAAVAADEITEGEGDGGFRIAPASDKTGGSGAWVQKFPNHYVELENWGGRADGFDALKKDNTIPLRRALATGLPIKLRGNAYYLGDSCDLPNASVIDGRDWNLERNDFDMSGWTGSAFITDMTGDHEDLDYLLKLGESCRIERVGFLHTGQPTPDGTFTPVATPTAILSGADDAAFTGSAGREYLQRLMFLGFSQFSNMRRAGSQAMIDGIYGQVLMEGIRMDAVGDHSAIGYLHFWPFLIEAQAFLADMLNNASGLVLGRVDNVLFEDLFVYGLNNAIKLIGSERTASLGQGVNKVRFGRVEADYCNNVVVDDASMTSRATLSFADMTYQSAEDASVEGYAFNFNQKVAAHIAHYYFSSAAGLLPAAGKEGPYGRTNNASASVTLGHGTVSEWDSDGNLSPCFDDAAGEIHVRERPTIINATAVTGSPSRLVRYVRDAVLPIIPNGDLAIDQKGAGSVSSPGGYVADIMFANIGGSGSGGTAERVELTAAEKALTGLGHAVQLVNTNRTDMRLLFELPYLDELADTKVCLSFWMKSTVTSPFASANMQQKFGAGGDAAVTTGLGGVLAASTSFRRHYVTANIPSIAGKSIGTRPSVRTTFNLTSALAQTLQVTGFQLDPGSRPQPYRMIAPSANERECQRYYREFDMWVPASPDRASFPIDMDGVPAVSGLGAGGSSTDTTAGVLVVSQTTAGMQAVILDSEYI
ncbi:MAG: hypothetical protein WA989_06185 [Henriciella sp.]|uniref:hypothetical protein n=1 Tax=Henriciella sp. TaxID=1968823 RepID=UPI003C76099C